MYLNIPQVDAPKVNGYVVVPYADTREVLYECERRYWDKDVHALYKSLSKTNINWPITPAEVLNENCHRFPRVAYFAIIED